jgi:hypothetical protein
MEMGEVEALREKLGLPSAPLVTAGLVTTALFFRSVLQEDPIRWSEYLRGIDFHKLVTAETLPAGTRLIRYDSLGERSLKPFSYFTSPGTSPHSLGTSFPSSQFKLFETSRQTPALKSWASSISFSPRPGESRAFEFDPVSRAGGGVQYIIAFSDLPPLFRVGDRGSR